VTKLIAAEKSKVKTKSTPIEFNICLGVTIAFPSGVLLLSLYIRMTGTTRRMKIITVIRQPTSVLIRELLYK